MPLTPSPEPNALRNRYDAIVVGGGPAGMSAAWEAALAGRSVLLVESGPVLGGLCATVRRDGFAFDLGGHRILSKRHALVSRLRALMGDALLERERHSVVLLGGKRYRYPLAARDLARNLAPDVLARALASYARARIAVRTRRAPADVTFRDWVVNRFGETLYDLFFGPYTAKLWGLDPRDLSADWAAQRISLLNLSDVALRLAGVRHGGARTYARRYLYPRDGIGSLFEHIATAITALGVHVVTGSTVAAVDRDARGAVTRVVLARDGASTTIECDAVFSTMPLEQLARVLEPSGTHVALAHRGLRFLNLGLRGAPVLGATWAYVADPRFAITRVQEPIARSRHLAPPGHTSLMLELPCDPGDAADTASEAQLTAQLVDELGALGMNVRERVVCAFTSRAPNAYPVYRHGYTVARDRLLAAVARAPNVWTFGRQGLFRYVFMDTAMEMGFAAARTWLEGGAPDARAMLAIDNNPTPHEAASLLG